MQSKRGVAAFTFFYWKEVHLEGVRVDLLAFDGKISFVKVRVAEFGVIDSKAASGSTLCQAAGSFCFGAQEARSSAQTAIAVA